MIDAVDAALAVLVRGEAPALFLLLDADDRVVSANRHTRELLGGAIEGRPFGEMLVNFERGLSPFSLTASGPLHRTVNLMTFTGLPQSFTSWMVRAGDKVVVVGGAEPREVELMRRELVTLTAELAARNRALQKANAELARVGGEKDLFLGMAAHDLRSPIMAVQSYLGFLRDDLADRVTEDERDYLAAMTEAAESMRSIVDSFLDVSRIEAGQLRLERAFVDPREVAARALRMVQPAARRQGVTLRTEAEGVVEPFSIDGPRILQALVNLLQNAVDHSSAGAAVVLGLRARGADLELEVRDRGTGIPPEIQGNLFTAFTRGGGRRSSGERATGLGLAITRRIIEAHRGTIAVASVPGQGTTFTLHLPPSAE